MSGSNGDPVFPTVLNSSPACPLRPSCGLWGTVVPRADGRTPQSPRPEPQEPQRAYLGGARLAVSCLPAPWWWSACYIPATRWPSAPTKAFPGPTPVLRHITAGCRSPCFCTASLWPVSCLPCCLCCALLPAPGAAWELVGRQEEVEPLALWLHLPAHSWTQTPHKWGIPQWHTPASKVNPQRSRCFWLVPRHSEWLWVQVWLLPAEPWSF